MLTTVLSSRHASPLVTATDTATEPRRAVRRHDPHAVDGRRAEGQLRPSGHADGARAARLRALHAGHAPQPGDPRLAGPRPLRALAPATPRCCCTRCCYLTRLRLDARRPQELPPARLARPPGHPEYGARARDRGDHRPARPGHRDAVGMALAERMLAARFNRDGHEIVDHHTFVIASDGDIEEGICVRGRLARRPPRPRPADRLLRRQPHLARGPTPRSRSREDVGARYEAYGWHVQHLGEDIALDALEQARARRRWRSRTARR